MVKIKQFNLSYLFNQLQYTMLECCFAQFLSKLKQNACIIAVKIIVNKSNNGRFTFEFGNSLDFE